MRTPRTQAWARRVHPLMRWSRNLASSINSSPTAVANMTTEFRSYLRSFPRVTSCGANVYETTFDSYSRRAFNAFKRVCLNVHVLFVLHIGSTRDVTVLRDAINESVEFFPYRVSPRKESSRDKKRIIRDTERDTNGGLTLNRRPRNRHRVNC